MRQKRLVQLFLAVSLLGIAPLPLLNLFFLYQQNALKSDSLTIQTLFNTDRIESNLNYFAYRTLHRSLNEKKTVVGKDGYLFLGNHYAHIIDKTRGTFPYTSEEVDRWAEGLLDIQEWFLARKIPFVFVLAPNKSSIYPEKLPDSIVYKAGETITDAIVRNAKAKGVALLDLREVLRAKKGDRSLYYLTDTHWNNLGASIAFEATIRFLDERYGLDLRIPDYHLREVREGAGDLAGFLKIEKVLPPDHERNYAFDFNRTVRVCHGIIDAKERSLHTCQEHANPILNVVVEDQYMVNKDPANQVKVLLLGDSFSTATSRLYNAAFGTLWKFHHSRLHGKALAAFVKEHRPDIVIYQIVERDLYTPTLVEPLPR
jgi:hypothetical protein